LPGSPAVPPAAIPAAQPITAPVAGALTGHDLLNQATVEFRKGDLELARRLALQAHNQGAQAEAKALLTQLDAEAFAARQRAAGKALDAAAAAAADRNHQHAFAVLTQIDPKMLPADRAAIRDDLIARCKAELDKAGAAGVVAAAGTQPGTAAVTDPKPAGPDSVTAQADAMRSVTFQKLRDEGLKVIGDAQAVYGRGETDVAIRMLADYADKVRAANVGAANTSLLLRPVDSRLEVFRVMKGQTDALAREKKERKDARELITGRGVAEENRKAEVKKYVTQYQNLVKAGNYEEAEKVALMAKQLDPDDPAVGALAHMAKMQGRVKKVEKQKAEKEGIVFGGLYDAENQGPLVTTQDPVAVRLEAVDRARRRGSLDEVYLRTRSPEELKIELNLDRRVAVEFDQTPLGEAVKVVAEKAGLPLTWDDRALEEEQVSRGKPVTESLNGYSARNALSILLDKAGLGWVVEYESVRVTTLKKAKGRLFTKVFSVADLVTPIPNYAIPEYANFEKMLKQNALNTGAVSLAGMNAPGSMSPNAGLGGGTPLAGANLGPNAPVGVGGRGASALEPNPTAAPTVSAGGLASENPKKSEALVKLITGMIRPHSWDGPHGGPGKVEYFDLGSALVVNQTADVIREVEDLLAALRRLQDLAVSVEVRIISLSEVWFERMGVDFAMNVKTNNTSFEPQLTALQFRPEPFINDINVKGATVGLQPAGVGSSSGVTQTPVFTPDLDVPFRATSFNRAIPGFGGYPNTPGFNGGVSLGLAFLNDIQVYLFMEAAQGDRRTNIMQAPKLTLFNGQTATITITDLQFFVTNVSVIGVNGQIIFVPTNTPLPGPGSGAITVALQAVVSADRRFVRINIPITISAESGASVPLFPVTTFIIPVFEGGSQGQPVPFTQFLQQPAFATMTIATTVVCPDGGTVLLGGLKKLSEGRNEFGPPFLSKIPYLNRLFKNVGIGRETSHIMIMVTPRIIINAEEEIIQTEGGAVPTGPGR
ncbi:MAG: hypothetical protein K2X82_02640, partial [Gemmataceae bacterium]|nr:hypothetical protein [Gemmataceae bacterium]